MTENVNHRAGVPSSKCVVTTATTDTTIYTVPSGRMATVSGILVANHSASANTVLLYDGASASSDLICAIEVPANDSKKVPNEILNGGMVLTTSLVAYSDAACYVTASVYES